MQYFCRHCGELIRAVRGKPRCPKGCRHPFPELPQCQEEELSEFFRRAQFMCPCCGQCKLDARLLAGLEQLRKLVGRDIEVVSAYRCPAHNRHVVGPSRKAHLEGRAADIRVSGVKPEILYALAEKVYDFRHGGIGLNDDDTVHVDVRVFRARWQRLNGKYLQLEVA